MSDPFSVAGSAVGIVSLGLAVCQGIIGYYNAYKGQEDEVDEMLEKTSRLASILKLLKPRLDRHKAAHPHTINQLMSCLASFDQAVAKLNTLIKKLIAVAVGHETIVQNQQLLLSRFEEIHRSIVTSRALFSAPAKAVTIPSKFLIPDRHLVSRSALVRKWTIQAILNFNQALGIFSITPTLTFRSVVPDDSPAFTLLSSAWHSKSLSETESAFQSLARTFQNGIAAPTDMNESGQTLLHNLKNVPEIVVGKELIEICMKYQKIVIGLLSIGVPADPIDNNGIHITDVYYSLTLVDRFHESLPPEYTKYLFQFGDQVVERLEFDFSNLSKMVLDMVKRDYKTSDGEKIRLVSFIAEFQRRSPHFTEGMECGKLSHAILRRSLEDVKKMVKSSPGALYERNVLQQSPLHLAAGWPAAMEVLLSSPTASEIAQNLEREVHAHAGFVPQSLRTTCSFPDEEDDVADARHTSLPAATILYEAGFRFNLGKLCQQLGVFSVDESEVDLDIEPAKMLDTLDWALQTQFFVQPLYRMATLLESTFGSAYGTMEKIAPAPLSEASRTFSWKIKALKRILEPLRIILGTGKYLFLEPSQLSCSMNWG
ncbi:hypothetical protein SLS57_008446 [Botryosphaeria dothidea]